MKRKKETHKLNDSIKFSPLVISDKHVQQFIDYQPYFFCLNEPITTSSINIRALQKRLNNIMKYGEEYKSIAEFRENHNLSDPYDIEAIEHVLMQGATSVFIEGDVIEE